MTEEERRARIREAIDQERRNPPGWWYLSFASEKGFLGACIVQGQGLATAIDRSHRLRINPGGEVMAWPVPPEMTLPAGSTDRLLSIDDLRRLGLGDKSIGEMSDAERKSRGL